MTICESHPQLRYNGEISPAGATPPSRIREWSFWSFWSMTILTKLSEALLPRVGTTRR